jgi:hypothetical protein
MPSIVRSNGPFTIAPNQTLIATTTFSPQPNQGPVFTLADPNSGQPVPAILITFDHSKNRNAPPPGGPGGPGTHEVFYQCKIRSESTQSISFGIEFFLPK